MKISVRILAAALPLLLAACAPQLVRNKGDAGLLEQQEQREQQLAGVDHWTIQGRMSVSDGKTGGSGSLTWTQNGDRYEFMMNFPGKSIRLTGGPEGALLEGAGDGPLRDVNAEALMERAMGWDVPLADLRAWVLGVRAHGKPGELSFGADRLPSQLEQDGWTVSYPAWDGARQPPLPTKVFAEKPPYKVRLSIESWTLQ